MLSVFLFSFRISYGFAAPKLSSSCPLKKEGRRMYVIVILSFSPNLVMIKFNSTFYHSLSFSTSCSARPVFDDFPLPIPLTLSINFLKRIVDETLKNLLYTDQLRSLIFSKPYLSLTPKTGLFVGLTTKNTMAG